MIEQPSIYREANERERMINGELNGKQSRCGKRTRKERAFFLFLSRTMYFWTYAGTLEDKSVL